MSVAAKAAGVTGATVQNWLRKARLQKTQGKVSLAHVVRCRDEWTTGRPPGSRTKVPKVRAFVRPQKDRNKGGVPTPHAIRMEFELWMRKHNPKGADLSRENLLAIIEKLAPIEAFLKEVEQLKAQKSTAAAGSAPTAGEKEKPLQ